MKSAKIENGTVSNIIEGALPGYVTCNDAVKINWEYDGINFIAPAPLPPTPDMVRAECERRMVMLLDARNAEDLKIKISNGTRDANRLMIKQIDEPGAWTPEDETRKTELIAADAALELLRAASNALEISLITDYENDIHWL